LFPLGFISVFNGVYRAAANAGHTLGTVFSPYRTPFFHMDGMEHTIFFALSAADAFVCDPKRLGFNKEPVKSLINRARFEGISPLFLFIRKRLPTTDMLRSCFYYWTGSLYHALGFLFARGAKHDDVIIRHHHF